MVHRPPSTAELDRLATHHDMMAAAQAQWHRERQALQPTRKKERKYNEVYTVVYDVDRELKDSGPIELGGGISITRMVIERSMRDMQDILAFHLLLPDGDKKIYTGPVKAFRECYTPTDIVMRALEHSQDE